MEWTIDSLVKAQLNKFTKNFDKYADTSWWLSRATDELKKMGDDLLNANEESSNFFKKYEAQQDIYSLNSSWLEGLAYYPRSKSLRVEFLQSGTRSNKRPSGKPPVFYKNVDEMALEAFITASSPGKHYLAMYAGTKRKKGGTGKGRQYRTIQRDEEMTINLPKFISAEDLFDLAFGKITFKDLYRKSGILNPNTQIQTLTGKLGRIG